MDTSAWAASAFGGLPYFNPMMMINTSETCAATRLIQCRDMGIMTNDVSRKFRKAPQEAPDLSEDEFLARKKVIDQVSRWCRDEGKPMENEWTPILYRYEIVKASAKRERDWGHMVFTDMTLTRFLMIMIFPSSCNCGNYSHHDYDVLTKYHADRFMSLLKCLHYEEAKPNWIRATFTTQAHQYNLDPVFFDNLKPPSGARAGDAKFPPIIQVTQGNFTPSLLPGELERIDNLLSIGKKSPIPASVRQEVTGSKDTRPDVSSAWKQRNPRQCAYCEKHGENKLMVCSRCKLVQYCGAECQKLAWPSHKLVCKKA